MDCHQFSCKYGFIYLWYDRKHKRYYIGSHWGQEDDGYICSSKWMKTARRRRPQDFKRRILKKIYTNREDLLNEEQRWLEMIKPEERKVRYYNLNLYITNSWLQNETEILTRKQRISAATREAMNRPEIREKYLEGLANRDKVSARPEVREKKRQTMKKNFEEGKINPVPPSQKGMKWWNNGTINKRAKEQPEGFLPGTIQVHTYIHPRNELGQFTK